MSKLLLKPKPKKVTKDTKKKKANDDDKPKTESKTEPKKKLRKQAEPKKILYMRVTKIWKKEHQLMLCQKWKGLPFQEK